MYQEKSGNIINIITNYKKKQTKFVVTLCFCKSCLYHPMPKHQPDCQVIIDDGFSMEEPVPKEIKAVVAMAGSLPCKNQPQYMFGSIAIGSNI